MTSGFKTNVVADAASVGGNFGDDFLRAQRLAGGRRRFALLVFAMLAACATLAASGQAQEPPERVAEEMFNQTEAGIPADALVRGWRGPWRYSALRPAQRIETPQSVDGDQGILIQGTGERNNPLRRELADAFRQPQLFVRFRFRYGDAASSDEIASAASDPEFCVLWLDRLDGSDRAVHNAGVPNIGVHVADKGPRKGQNVFMIRIGASRTAWSDVPLVRGRTYTVVGRLSKSKAGERTDYDRFDLWVDPRPEDLASPAASVRGGESINFVRWVGFATGLKTEADDRIYVDDLVLSRAWSDVLDANTAGEFPPADSSNVTPLAWDKPVDFRRDVHPLLAAKCFDCHAGENSESGYRLDVRGEILGYSTGEALAVPGASAQSRLIHLVSSEDGETRMPPADAGPALSEREVALLRAWIDQGLKWDDELLPPPPRRTSDHWAFQVVERPSLPSVSQTQWVRTPVDAFIAARHEQHGISPAPQASRRTLIRRLYLDLLGLPPTPQQIDAFVADESPEAYEQLVERLLASPHYGERWGRYWLDLARWAESHGYQHDLPRPYAWRYRDYVIRSFNDDKPYDRFLAEQIAGDELRPYRDEHVIATGFLAAARISGNQMDKAIQRNDVLVDIVNATSSVVLGLTLECAQCHNHKFDPLSQRDYYRLQGFFVDGQLGNLALQNAERFDPEEVGRWMPGPVFDFYRREADKLVKKKRFAHTAQPHTWGYYSPATGHVEIDRLPVVNRDPLPYHPETLTRAEARMLIRGDARRPGPIVGSGWPEVLGETPPSLGPARRTALAEWFADRSNPLVSRVWANRIWQHHFGRGIVASESDFGTRGEAPSHPQLLDWLAAELMDRGWSTKHLHRLIVLSSTYRQARRTDAASAAIDPDNTLLWCWPGRRLEAEAIRDSILVAAGELNPHVGGPSIPPQREEQELRRTIYLYQRRSEMPDVMSMFDGPQGIHSCSRRDVSTVALQPLFLLNSEFMVRRAEALAVKIRNSAGDDVEAQVRLAFLRTLGREPNPAELERSVAFVKQQAAGVEDRALTHFCHALLNLNEFVYIP
ncbi:MAG: PSD1 and planctomycete cytochrome C domain-containing protein [Pirellulaceae bacterium]